MMQALEAGEKPLGLLHVVLNPALKEVGERFDKGEVYLLKLILSAETMEVAVKLCNLTWQLGRSGSSAAATWWITTRGWSQLSRAR
jgi:methanogenic corrinoid protein MtbC1